MALTVGSRLGHYDVTALIGEGGMGQVYRAIDTQLGRDVALKILPDAFAADPDRLARFQREAQVLASLNHPGIAAIYGIEKSEATQALVLELVEGPTLADRIAKGPIPLDEALPIAKQIAEALEAAHEAGVIHRDLKPANIKVREDGTVKVLDFGLAKALDTAPAGDPSQSPTLTAAATQMGVIMGTAAYMSPEQARGKPVDKRTDIWAFGVVLYEMLAGARPFQGEDVSLTLASVMKSDVDVRTLLEVPDTLRRVLDRCLQKDPRERIRDIGDVRLALKGAFETTPSTLSEPSIGPQLGVWQRPVPALLAAAVLVVLTGLTVWSLGRPTVPDPPRVTRFSVALPDGVRFGATARHLVALSSDGTRLAYRAGLQTYVRDMDRAEAVPVQGLQGFQVGVEPFFSPDGQSLGFHANGQLRRVEIGTGTSITLASSAAPTGASWEADGTILFSPQRVAGIWRVSADGGRPELLIEVADGEQVQGPSMLPGDEWVLFTLRPVGVENWEAAQIVVQSIETGQREVLFEGGRDVRYVSTGHLVYAQDYALFAVPFDTATLSVGASPVLLVEGVLSNILGGAVHFSVADDGTLAYISRGPVDDERHLAWVDRDGREEPLTVAGAFETLDLSPDGSRAAFGTTGLGGANADVWISQLGRGDLTRLTTDPAVDESPLWSRDGRRVAFTTDRNGRPEVMWKAADGTGTAESIVVFDESANRVVPSDWSPDGTTLVVTVALRSSDQDVVLAPVDGDGKWTPLLETDADEHQPAISPNGRWIAFSSNENGSYEVNVQRFPEGTERQPVSVGTGQSPTWSVDGREILYLRAPAGPPDAIMRVSIAGGDDDTEPLVVGTPELLFDDTYFNRPGGQRSYDVSPDDGRLLVIAGRPSSGVRTEVQVVLNWFEELKARVPVP